MRFKKQISVAAILLSLAAFLVASFLAARVLKYAGGSSDPGTRRGALMEATQAGDVTAMRVILMAGANPNPDKGTVGYPVLSIAAMTGDMRAARLLLESGALPDGGDSILNGTPEIARAVARAANGPSVVSTFDRPLFVAVVRDRAPMIDLLRANGAKYEPIDALFLGDRETVKEALEKDPEAFTSLKFFENSLLFAAVEFQNLNAARALLEMGFDPNELGADGQSALEFAKRTRNADLVELFASRGAVEVAPAEE